MGQPTDGIDITLLSIRETLMEYFKGSCVQKVTSNSNVRLNIMQISEATPQRWWRSFESPCLLLLSEVPIATLGKNPDTITFHVDVVRRSPQLRQIRGRLDKFLSEYLPGVAIAERGGNVLYG